MRTFLEPQKIFFVFASKKGNGPISIPTHEIDGFVFATAKRIRPSPHPRS